MRRSETGPDPVFTTQDEIARRTGTQVVVRGRYTPPGAPPAGDEPPLFLKVTPGLVASEVHQQRQSAGISQICQCLVCRKYT